MYKNKKGDRLVVNIPSWVVDSLGIKDGDEVDFAQQQDRSVAFSKRGPTVQAVSKLPDKAAQISVPTPIPANKYLDLTKEELDVLKKLDTLKYGQRTKENVRKIMDAEENRTLQGLLKRNIVSLYKKEGESEEKYGITKSVYDKFLFGRRLQKSTEMRAKQTKEEPSWVVKLKEHNKYAEALESNGYLVLQTHEEASELSTLMEESIRLGLIVGTRAFDRKFYVALKRFVTQNTARIMSIIQTKSVPVPEISQSMGMEDDAARTILHILAESGEVTEVKKDVFRAA